MIISKIQGGLGNQLFQWAYGRNLSLKYNTQLYMDTRFYDIKSPDITKRNFNLDKFPNINYNLINNDVIRNFNSNGYPIIYTDNFHYIDLEYNNNLNYYLDGYWQSEKYFKEIENIIRQELSPNKLILDKISKVHNPEDNNVSLHIRRTDYITSNGVHPIQPISYYEEALNIIKDYDNILVFSDDIEWCKNNLHFYKMLFIENNTDIEDLYIMASCKNNIIANSSFSWWGAWLNNNPDKKIITPINWFGIQANLNTSDMMPNNWIKI